MKILCYSAKLASGLNVDKNPDLAKRLAIISSKISGARATLRLIDDIPMLQHTLEYGFGSKASTINSYRFYDYHCPFELIINLFEKKEDKIKYKELTF